MMEAVKIGKQDIIARYQAGEKVAKLVSLTGSYSAIYDTLAKENIPLRRGVKATRPGNLIQWGLPPQLAVAPDPLRLRLDFHNDTVLMTIFEKQVEETRLVSAMDVAHTLADELSYGTGLLPENTLWWQNTPAGPIVALWEPPKIWKVAVASSEEGPATIRRYELPLPGLIFLCHAGDPPWVYAATSRPTKDTDEVFKAPLANIYDDGRSCAGSNKYPDRVAEIPQSFFLSFFSRMSNGERSKSHPTNIIDLWKEINHKKEFPITDLVRHGTVKDLLTMFNHMRRSSVDEDDDEDEDREEDEDDE
jgi:PRTRC genetic system protein B